MTYFDPIEVEHSRKDRAKKVRHEVKQLRGTTQSQTKVRERPLLAVLAVGALLSLIAGF